ncbi:MAG: hypothetical protein K1X72_21145 [Pyrinomonadaceae bacterium]|nr:hypothetical protein [Pyrinomonadaceae bacterium]
MDAIVSSDTTINSNSLTPTSSVRSEQSLPTTPVISTADVAMRLGVWLSGLYSFLQIRNYSFGESNRAKASTRDWTKEFHLTNTSLLLCSKLTLQLLKTLGDQKYRPSQNNEAIVQSAVSEFSFEEISELAEVLKHSILLNEALLRSTPLRFGEWIAWANILNDKLKQVEVIQKLIVLAEKEGEKFLPKELQRILESKPIPFAVEADLRIILPRIAKILKWLDVINEMRQKDEPLKTTLLLFARIYEQTQEMMSYISNRLLRFPNENDPVFEALDSTIYAASIESKKVFNYELAGLTEIRQTPRIFAKVETSYSLLNDSFQQTLVNFAQLIEPNVDPSKIFPNFKTKLEQSLALRRNLWFLQQAVQKAEQSPDNYPMDGVFDKVSVFLKENLRYLFYKDCETVERFAEEVLRTTNKKDLVPILHRFGAYLETLLGQVNMRTLLANHPFDYPKE